MTGALARDAAAAARAFVDAKAAGRPHRRSSRSATGRSRSPASRPRRARPTAPWRGSRSTARRAPRSTTHSSCAARSLRTSTQPGRVIVLLTDGTTSRAPPRSRRRSPPHARRMRPSIRSGSRAPTSTPARCSTLARGDGRHLLRRRLERRSCGRSTPRSRRSSTARGGSATTRSARPGDHVRVRVAVPGAGAVEQAIDVPSSFGSVEAVPASRLLPSFGYTLARHDRRGAPRRRARARCALHARAPTRRELARAAPRAARRRRRSSAAPVAASGCPFLKALFKATEGALGRHSQWRSIQRLARSAATCRSGPRSSSG